jgi:hypothetical protein
MTKKDALLVEYRVAHDEVDRLNRQLWTTAQVLLPLSLAGASILSNFLTHTVETLTTIILSAIGSTLILLGWYGVAKRWLAYQDIALYRMAEIEKELLLWRVRYELFASKKSRGEDLLDGKHDLSKIEKSRFGGIARSMIPGGRPTAIIVRNLTMFMILTWIFLIFREFAFYMGII